MSDPTATAAKDATAAAITGAQIIDPGTTADDIEARKQHLFVEGDFVIKQPCGFPAPLVLNGSPFVGCQLDKAHAGQHKVEIVWGTA